MATCSSQLRLLGWHRLALVFLWQQRPPPTVSSDRSDPSGLCALAALDLEPCASKRGKETGKAGIGVGISGLSLRCANLTNGCCSRRFAGQFQRSQQLRQARLAGLTQGRQPRRLQQAQDVPNAKRAILFGLTHDRFPFVLCHAATLELGPIDGRIAPRAAKGAIPGADTGSCAMIRSSVARPRLTRLLTVPRVQPQASAVSSCEKP